MLNHENIKLILPAVAMGTANMEENQVVEQHLLECAVCHEQLAEFRSTCTVLALGLEKVEPPKELKAKTREYVLGEKSKLQVSNPRSKPIWNFAGARAALVLSALLIGFFAGTGTFMERKVSTVKLEGTRDPQALSQSPKALFAEEDRIVTVKDMPDPDSNATWQIWSINKDGDKRSLGIFEEGGKMQVVVPTDAQLVAITKEPAGGSVQPTTDPAWSANIV